MRGATGGPRPAVVTLSGQGPAKPVMIANLARFPTPHVGFCAGTTIMPYSAAGSGDSGTGPCRRPRRAGTDPGLIGWAVPAAPMVAA
jgi:hypothetical protein